MSVRQVKQRIALKCLANVLFFHHCSALLGWKVLFLLNGQLILNTELSLNFPPEIKSHADVCLVNKQLISHFEVVRLLRQITQLLHEAIFSYYGQRELELHLIKRQNSLICETKQFIHYTFKIYKKV